MMYRENEDQEASYTRGQDALSRAEEASNDVLAIKMAAEELFYSIDSLASAVQQSYESAQGFCVDINTAQTELDALIWAAEQAADDDEVTPVEPAVCQDTNVDANGNVTLDKF